MEDYYTSRITAQDLDFTLIVKNIADVQSTMVLVDIDELGKDAFSNLFKNIVKNCFKNEDLTIIDVRSSLTIEVQGDAVTREFSRNNRKRTLFKDDRERDESIDEEITSLFAHFDPEAAIENNMAAGETGYEAPDSSYRLVIDSPPTLKEITIILQFPYEYNANALNHNAVLKDKTLSDNVRYIRNKDKFCVLHTIFTKFWYTEPLKKRVVNLDEDYMQAFIKWFKTNQLDDFYEGDKFLTHKVKILEERLKISINIYICHNDRLKKVNLHRRSDYKYDDDIIDLVYLGLDNFKLKSGKETGNLNSFIRGKEFYTNGQVYQMNGSHCGELKSTFFIKNKGEHSFICKYCKYCSRSKHVIENHEILCKDSFKNKNEEERIVNYREPLKHEKEFSNFSSLNRTPFAVGDFETRTVDGKEITRKDGTKYKTKEQVPYSYSLKYVNPFKNGEELIYMKISLNPKKLTKEFAKDCAEIAKFHHEQQCVDVAGEHEPYKFSYFDKDDNLVENGSNKIGTCPFCYKDMKRPEYNHTHFKDDDLNLELNTYICKLCNAKNQVKNKGLSLFFHGGSKFDFNLFAAEMFNSKLFSKPNLIAKNESRYTQMTFCVNNSDAKIVFKDSILLLGGSLESITNAWIGEKDYPDIKKALEDFYKCEVSDELVKLSRTKQVFPYEVLSDMKTNGPRTDYITKKEFYNTLKMKDVSNSEYKAYKNAFDVLKNEFGSETCFQDYHDYYLLLDVVLLGQALKNFMNNSHQLSGLNPLAYLSTPAWTFNSHLYTNLKNKEEVITLPKLHIQKFLCKSIHGGFTMIFNKLNTITPKNLPLYVDFTSMYPAVMSLCKLPYRHIKSFKNPTKEDYKNMLEDLDHYYFVEVDIKPLDQKYRKRCSILPQFPGAYTVKEEDLSEDQKMRWKKNTGSEYKEKTINTVTFFEKKNYICSATYLRNAIELGYEVSKIHRIEKFKQGFVMKKYIDIMYKIKAENSKLSKNPNLSKEEVTVIKTRILLAKIILNALYGFTITNVMKMSDVTIESIDSHLLRKRVSSLKLKSMLKVGDSVVLNSHKSSISFDYPIMLGSAILFESKNMMSKAVYGIYDFLEKKGCEMEPLMTDTDSYFFNAKNFKNVWNDYEGFASEYNKTCGPLFDTSGFKEENRIHSTEDALGMFTNEADGCEVKEFVGICAKVYSYTTDKDESKVKGKGIHKNVAKEKLSHEIYKRVVTGEIFNIEKDVVQEDGSLASGKDNINPFINSYTAMRIDSSRSLKMKNIEIVKPLVSLVDIKSRSVDGINYEIYG